MAKAQWCKPAWAWVSIDATKWMPNSRISERSLLCLSNTESINIPLLLATSASKGR
jgi:hypothetical protein